MRITPHSFRRIITSGTYIPEVDGLRFIAIVSVVALHCYAEMLDRMGISFASLDAAHPLLRFVGHGGYGVEVFFAISGFILALPFARQYLRAGREVRLSTYFLRRLTRLEPPYIVWLLIRTALLLAAGALPLHFLLTHLLASVLYMHNIAFAIASRIEAVSWTLEIEVQFYCLAPILTLIYRIAHPWLRRLLLSACIAIATPLQWAFLPGWHGAQNAGVFNLSLLAAIQFFLAGLLVADFYVDGWARIPTTWRWDAVSFVFWPLLFWLQPHAFRFLGPLILPVLFIGGVQRQAGAVGSPQSRDQHHRRYVLQHLSDASHDHPGRAVPPGALSSPVCRMVSDLIAAGSSRIRYGRRPVFRVHRTALHGPEVAAKVTRPFS